MKVVQKLSEKIQVQRLTKDGILPTRGHPDDTGIDITPTRVFKQLRCDTWLLGTDIAIKPPTGTYIDLVGRSSISKTEVFVANAFGVMDLTYRGEFFIAITPKIGVDLATFDPQSLITGKPLVQGILRDVILADIEEVDKLDDTERGDGGFGSTDKK
jgi:dUTP pyrophosphatase